MRTILKGKRIQWQLMTERYSRFRRTRAQLVKLFTEIIKLIDKDGHLRINCKGFNNKNDYRTKHRVIRIFNRNCPSSFISFSGSSVRFIMTEFEHYILPTV